MASGHFFFYCETVQMAMVKIVMEDAHNTAQAVVRYYSDGSTYFILLRPRHISCSKSIGPVFFDALDGYRTEIAILLLCIVLYCIVNL